MSKQPHNILFGQDGEKKATQFLRSQGYQILETNFRTKFGELDIVAQQGEELVFVEVKNRSNDFYDDASTVVSSTKIARLNKAANLFLMKIQWKGDYRFDLITIFSGQIEHFENITLDY